MFSPFEKRSTLSMKKPLGKYSEGAYERGNQTFGNFQGLRYSLHR